MKECRTPNDLGISLGGDPVTDRFSWQERLIGGSYTGLYGVGKSMYRFRLLLQTLPEEQLDRIRTKYPDLFED